MYIPLYEQGRIVSTGGDSNMRLKSTPRLNIMGWDMLDIWMTNITASCTELLTYKTWVALDRSDSQMADAMKIIEDRRHSRCWLIQAYGHVRTDITSAPRQTVMTLTSVARSCTLVHSSCHIMCGM